jgi:hypothetical protein
LFDDVAECEELLDRSDTQFARRAFVRAAFAFDEGYLYWLKERVAQWLLGKGWLPNIIEITKLVLLSDETYRPNQQGKVEWEPNRIPFKNYCAFVLRTAAECWDFDPTQLFSDNGWKKMQDALKVRHRITDPKKSEDLEITDQELCSTSEGCRWLFNCLIDILNSIPQDTDDSANP